MFRMSRLHEIMKALPRSAFQQIADNHRADKHSKGFGCWSQLVAIVYAQLSEASSLRVLEAGFNSQRTQLGDAAWSILICLGLSKQS